VPERPRLRAIDLTGGRAALRLTLFITTAIAAIVALIGYVLPAHRLEYVPPTGAWLDLTAQAGETSFHSNLADGGWLPLFILPVVAIGLFVLRRLRFGAGFFAAVLGGGGALLVVSPVLLVHMFSKYETAAGEGVFQLGLLVLFVASCALLVAEPAVYLLERRRIIRASQPAPLPTAIAL